MLSQTHPPTYELSQYSKAPRPQKEGSPRRPSETNYNYDQFFNQNYTKSISLPDYDLEEKNKSLLNSVDQLENFNSMISNENNELKDQISKLIEDNTYLQEKIEYLNDQNVQMNALINEQKDQLKAKNNEIETLNVNYKKMTDGFDKCNADLNNSNVVIKDLTKENNQLREEIDKVINENRIVHADNINLNDTLNSLKITFEKLRTDYSYLQKNYDSNDRNKTSIIDDLKNQLDLLNNKFSRTLKESEFFQEKFNNLKDDSSKQIDDLYNQLSLSNNDKENFENKYNEIKKLNQKYNREKDQYLKKINDLDKDLNNAIIKNKKRNINNDYNADNNMLFECLKNENFELKDINGKYKKIIDITFNFINQLNDLFSHNDISTNDALKNINLLNEDLLFLKEQIGSLLKGSDNDAKWEGIQNQLLNKNNNNVNNNVNVNNNEGPNDEDRNEWKDSKCYACNLGRNVTLKGCSPYFCKKHNKK